MFALHRAFSAGMDVWWCDGDYSLFSRGTHLPISHALLLWPWGELPQHSGKVSTARARVTTVVGSNVW